MKIPSILVVEDEQIVAAGLRKRLQQLGYDVPGMAASGPEAIELAERYQPNLVLMDIRLEGSMDGIEAAGRIRSRFHLPVVYLTAYSNQEILDRAKVTEPFGYVLKPYQERELHVVIETALYKHQMERKLHERERLVAATLNSIGDGVVATNSEGRITFMNPVAERLTGWQSADAIGQQVESVFSLIHEETRAPLETPLRTAIEHKQAVPMANHAILVARDSSERPVEDCASPILDDSDVPMGGVMVFRDISERRLREALRLEVFRREQVEAELRRHTDELVDALGISEERLRQVIQSDLIGIFSWDEAGNVLEANDAFLRFTGYQREELGAGLLRWSDLTPEEFHHLDRQAARELQRQGKCTSYETQCLGKDGRRIPILVGAVVLEGRSDRGVAFVLDLSEQKKAEEQAALHFGQLRKLSEASALINGTLSQEHVSSFVTAKAGEIVGANLTVMTIRRDDGWVNVVHSIAVSEGYEGGNLNPAKSSLFADLCRRDRPLRLTQAETENDPAWMRLKEMTEAADASLRGVLAAPLIGLDGSRLGLILLSHKKEGEFTASDEAIVRQLAQMASVAIENARLYSEVQSSQEVLSQKEKHLRAIINTTPACVKLISSEGILLEMNPAGLAMLEASGPEAVLGQEVYSLIAPEYREAFRAFNERVCSGEGGRLEYEIVGLKGKRLQVEARSACLRRFDGDRVNLSITQDFTERNRLQARYLQAQKMEAVGRLAGGIAHDFNNLLTVINGYGMVLLHMLEGQEHAKDLITQILQSGDRAASLTQQLLAYSRKQHQFLRVLILNDLVRETERMLRRMIGEDVELVTVLEGDLAPIKADPSQIDQVMMNLAVNARDAMPQGGRLTISTQNVRFHEDVPGGHFNIPVGQYVQLAVSDNGVGMDAATLEQVFEPFFTTKETGKGTGLGLATVYGIIKQSGGFIQVSSELGVGTTFDIYFPVAPPESAEKGKSFPDESAPGGNEVVLLAEDEESVRSLIRYLLEGQGYTVLVASCGSEALTLAQSYSGQIDLLITDVVMPRMSGPQLAQELRKTRTGLRILYLSGYADDSVFHHGLNEKEAAFLQKPFANSSLALKVRQVLDDKTSSQPSDGNRPPTLG